MSDLPERLLCRDKTCTGTINEKGYCNVCGKSLDEKHDPLRAEKKVDVWSDSGLTEFQLECKRILIERVAQVGGCISNRALRSLELDLQVPFWPSRSPQPWRPPPPEPEEGKRAIEGHIEGTDIDFCIYEDRAQLELPYGGAEFVAQRGESLVGVAEEFVDNVLEAIRISHTKMFAYDDAKGYLIEHLSRDAEAQMAGNIWKVAEGIEEFNKRLPRSDDPRFKNSISPCNFGTDGGKAEIRVGNYIMEMESVKLSFRGWQEL